MNKNGIFNGHPPRKKKFPFDKGGKTINVVSLTRGERI